MQNLMGEKFIHESYSCKSEKALFRGSLYASDFHGFHI